MFCFKKLNNGFYLLLILIIFSIIPIFNFIIINYVTCINVVYVFWTLYILLSYQNLQNIKKLPTFLFLGSKLITVEKSFMINTFMIYT